MKELSLNVLDITKNSVKAGASLIHISLVEVGGLLTLTITDNGCGMKPEVLETVMNPFYTTRTTRKVGMGIPLLMLAAEQTGGTVTIESRHEEEHPDGHGTTVTATFRTHVYNMVGHLYDIEIVFYYYHGITFVNKTVYHSHKHSDILEMQTGSRLVEQIEGLACIALGKLGRELHALRFAA